MPEAKLLRLHDVHAFLCPKAYRFYIPAYMIWTLRHLQDQRGEHVQFNGSTIFSFNPTSAYGRERFALLDASQRRAVWRFLRYVADHCKLHQKEAERYVREYWGGFAA